MKKLFALAVALAAAAGIRAATPSLSDFDTNYFQINATQPRITILPGSISSPTGGISSATASNLAFRISSTNSTTGNSATATLATNAVVVTNVADYVFNSATPFATMSNVLSSTAPKNIWFQGGTYNNVTNIFINNHTHIQGNRSHLMFESHQIGWLADTSTNTDDIIIEDLWFDGGAYPTPGYSDPTYFVTHNSSPDPTYSVTFSNRNGLRFNASSGGRVVGCTFSGFGGNGVMLESTNNGNAQVLMGGFFYGNHAFSNYVNICILGPAINYSGTNNAPAPLQVSASDEYQIVLNNESYLGAIGVSASAGNHIIEGFKITGNNIGVFVGNAANNGHGQIIGNSLNHNNHAWWFEAGPLNETVQNNLVLACNDVYMNNVDADIQGNYFGGSPITIFHTNTTGSGTKKLIFKNNTYVGAWGTDIKTNFNQGGGTLDLTFGGNHSMDTAGDFDGSATSYLEHNAYIPPVFMGTNVTIVQGANMTITPSFSGGVMSYSFASSGSGGGVTNNQVLPGANVTNSGNFTSSGLIAGNQTIATNSSSSKLQIAKGSGTTSGFNLLDWDGTTTNFLWYIAGQHESRFRDANDNVDLFTLYTDNAFWFLPAVADGTARNIGATNRMWTSVHTTNVFAKSVTVSNLTSGALVQAGSDFALKSLAIGSGLSSDGTTLTATASGSGVTNNQVLPGNATNSGSFTSSGVIAGNQGVFTNGVSVTGPGPTYGWSNFVANGEYGWIDKSAMFTTNPLTGTWQWLSNSVTIKSNALTATWTLQYPGSIIISNGVSGYQFSQTNGVCIITNSAGAGKWASWGSTGFTNAGLPGNTFSGDGGGLSGVTASATTQNTFTNLIATNAILSAVSLESYVTNKPTTGNGTLTLDMTKPQNHIETNAPITISLTGLSTTNVQLCELAISNSLSSGTIAVTLNGFAALTNSYPTSTFYVTNNSAKRQITLLDVKWDPVGSLTNGLVTHVFNP